MVTSLHLYTGLMLAVGLERLLELRLSKRNAEWAFSRGAHETGQRHYRVMTVLHTAFLIACIAEPWVLGRPFLPWLGWPMLAVALAAQALRYWAITTLGHRWNTRIIVLPDAEPVTGGPYRYFTHPNYIAVVTELAALPLVHSGWLTALFFSACNAVLLAVRIRAEETALGLRWAQHFKGPRV
jgi:methyltransferase